MRWRAWRGDRFGRTPRKRARRAFAASQYAWISLAATLTGEEGAGTVDAGLRMKPSRCAHLARSRREAGDEEGGRLLGAPRAKARQVRGPSRRWPHAGQAREYARWLCCSGMPRVGSTAHRRAISGMTPPTRLQGQGVGAHLRRQGPSIPPSVQNQFEHPAPRLHERPRTPVRGSVRRRLQARGVVWLITSAVPRTPAFEQGSLSLRISSPTRPRHSKRRASTGMMQKVQR